MMDVHLLQVYIIFEMTGLGLAVHRLRNLRLHFGAGSFDFRQAALACFAEVLVRQVGG